MIVDLNAPSDSQIVKSSSPVWGMAVKVKKNHIDVWGHTNNVCYVKWLQDVATGHSAAIGWDPKRYLDNGAIWVVRNHSIDYKRSSYLGNRILVQTWIEEMKKASCLRRYRFIEFPEATTDEEVAIACGFAPHSEFIFPQSALLATASTKWAFISTETLRPIKVFPDLVAVFRKDSDGAKFPQYG